MRCSYLVHVLVNVAAGDGGVGDKVKELSDRHHRHTVLHKEVWMEAQDVILKFGGGGRHSQGHKSAESDQFVLLH